MDVNQPVRVSINQRERQHQGAKVDDVCRRLGVSRVTFYRWKAKFAGMQVSDAKRLRQLEDENRRLKQMMADQALDLQALKAVLRKKKW